VLYEIIEGISNREKNVYWMYISFAKHKIIKRIGMIF